MTEDEANRYLSDELAKMKIKHGINIDGMTSDSNMGACLIRLQCLYVMRSQKSQLNMTDADLANLHAEIKSWENVLFRGVGATIVQQSETSIFKTPSYLRYNDSK